MAHILKLPNELLDNIVQELEYGEEVNNLSQTCRRLYGIASYRLYPGYATQYTPPGLSRIVANGNIESLRKLIDSGISFTRYSRMMGYRSPLPEAIKNGQFGIAKLLVDTYGSEISSGSLSDTGTAVIAVEKDRVDILQLLFKTGLSEHDAVQALCNACDSKDCPLSMIQYLVSELGIDVNARSGDDETAIERAMLAGRLDIVKYLVDAGATIVDILQAAPDHRSMLYQVASGRRFGSAYRGDLASQNRVDMVQYLLEKGANVKGFTATQFQDLVANDSQDCAVLISKRIGRGNIRGRLNKVSSDKTLTAYLYLAAGVGDEVLFAKVMDRLAGRVDLSETDVLRIAASGGYKTIVMTLLDILRDNPDDDFPSEYSAAIYSAIRGNHTDVVIAILDHGAHAWIKSRPGIMWLTAAAENGRDSICLCLIKRGALKFLAPRQKYNSDRCRWATKIGVALGEHFTGDMTVLRQTHRALHVNLNWDDYNHKVSRGVLCGAAASCDEKHFKTLSERYSQMTGPDEDGWFMALTNAVREGKPETVTCALRRVHPNYLPYEQWYGGKLDYVPILVHCAYGLMDIHTGSRSLDTCLNILRQLLVNGADVDELNSSGVSALKEATYHGDMVVHFAKELIYYGAGPLTTAHKSPTPLEMAIRMGRPKLVELYLKTLEDRGTLEENWSLIEEFTGPEQLAWESYEAETINLAHRDPPGHRCDTSEPWNKFLVHKTIRKYKLRMASQPWLLW